MARSLKKGLFVDEKLKKKVLAAKSANDRKPIKTWSRSCTVFPEMVGIIMAIHDGKNHISVLISEEMVGHKLGEFAPTTKFKGHGGRRAREEEKGGVRTPAGSVAPKEDKENKEVKGK